MNGTGRLDLLDLLDPAGSASLSCLSMKGNPWELTLQRASCRYMWQIRSALCPPHQRMSGGGVPMCLPGSQTPASNPAFPSNLSHQRPPADVRNTESIKPPCEHAIYTYASVYGQPSS